MEGRKFLSFEPIHKVNAGTEIARYQLRGAYVSVRRMAWILSLYCLGLENSTSKLLLVVGLICFMTCIKLHTYGFEISTKFAFIVERYNSKPTKVIGYWIKSVMEDGKTLYSLVIEIDFRHIVHPPSIS
ncbi:MAG: hypothetical protein Q8K86_10600 [Candidatus Nanopelagicaceae bacterium]|nr:hypothetical protein [Candidatus Nanopelagicaceae bacterium]